MTKYHIIQVDGKLRSCISIQGEADPYGTPREFTQEEASHWIENHSYKGMSFHYEMEKIKL